MSSYTLPACGALPLRSEPFHPWSQTPIRQGPGIVDMKITHKLVLSFVLVTALAAGSSVFELISYQEINESFGRLVSEPIKKVEALNSLKQAGWLIISSTSEYAFVHSEGEPSEHNTHDDREDDQIEAGFAAYSEALARYEQLVGTATSDDISNLGALRSLGKELKETSGQIVDLKKRNVRGREVLQLRERFEEAEIAFTRSIDESLERESALQEVEQRNVQSRIAGAKQRTIASTSIAMVAALVCGILISLRISRRVKRLKAAAARIGEGDLKTRIGSAGKDEIGELARAFDLMISDLRVTQEFMNRLNRDLTRQRERYFETLNNLPCVVWEVPLDIESTVTSPAYINSYVEKMYGYTAEEWFSTPDRWMECIHPDDRERMRRQQEDLFEQGQITNISRWITKDGRTIWGETRVLLYRDDTGKPLLIRGVTTDITERKSLEDQLAYEALHDPLTSLPNRVLFRDRLIHALNRSRRMNTPIAVLFIDLDNFKAVNDTLGHAAGDELLLSVSERLRDCLRDTDTPARFGGDEFAVLLEDTEHAQSATLVAERIRTVMGEPYSIGGKRVYISTSIGIAIATGSETPEELLRDADVAMYTSKTSGKNRFTVFESQMHDAILKRSEIEADLRIAIGRGEFEAYYQPIIDLQTQNVMGMEALIRWNHPLHGLISPADFIPIADETGLIIPIGSWILEEACRQTKEWQRLYGLGDDISITVNVSNRQFIDEGFHEIVETVLANTGLAPHCLVLEITEGTMLSNTEGTVQQLFALKGLGVRFAVDDFGTGYSSLSYLQQFPVDILKIDKLFIDKISNGREGAAVAKAIISMGETLHLKTIAEGVETPNQIDALKQLGCEMGQGYHFARPLEAESMGRFLRSSLNSAQIYGTGRPRYWDLNPASPLQPGQ